MEVGPFDSPVGLIIQVRMNSSRLKGKVLFPLPLHSQQSILEYILKQLLKTDFKVVVATSCNAENDPIELLCDENSIKCFRGSEDDVLSRFISIQMRENFKYIFRFTGDNPFIDLGKMMSFFSIFTRGNYDYAKSKGMPLGMNFEIFTGKALTSLSETNLTRHELEHVTLKFQSSTKYLSTEIELESQSHLRLTVDTPSDYALANIIATAIGSDISLNRILWIFHELPWIYEINRHVKQNP